MRIRFRFRRCVFIQRLAGIRLVCLHREWLDTPWVSYHHLLSIWNAASVLLCRCRHKNRTFDLTLWSLHWACKREFFLRARDVIRRLALLLCRQGLTDWVLVVNKKVIVGGKGFFFLGEYWIWLNGGLLLFVALLIAHEIVVTLTNFLTFRKNRGSAECC